MSAPQALRRMAPRVLGRALDASSVVSLLALCALVLVAAGQPLFTDDLWWHLALGDAYASQGPWLAADPLLFTATGPPAPASWLADLSLARLAGGFGFDALRVLHVALVAALLFGVFRLARRAGAAALLALAATALFAALAAYRLVQLRPHFATIGFALLLYRWLLEGRDAPTGLRMALAVAGMALWSNLHGGFLLGPAMSLAAAAALALASLRAGDERPGLRERALRVAATGVLGLLATGANPSGFAHHLAFFTAGADTPALGIVLDEWAHLDPFSWPLADLPPSPLEWGLFWLLLLATPWASWRLLTARGTRPLGELAPLVALALASLAATIFAVRFAWMSVFPLLLVVRALAPGPARAGARVATAVLSPLLLAGFVVFGSWPMLSQGLRLQGFWQAYRPAYPPGKYYAHATGFLADSGLEGRLFNEYVCGGFVGYWLAPGLRGFVNGTMNVPLAAMEALEAIREGRGGGPLEGQGEAGDESLAALLDHYQLDVFLGVGVPALPRGSRPRHYSTALLEDLPGWIPVFRSQRAAVYLRSVERNRENLQRVVDYYAAQQVPFDPATGFDAARVIERAPQWAALHGVVPASFRSLQAAARGASGPVRTAAWQRLSLVYGMLGLYEPMLRMDRRVLRESPDDTFARRRRVWALLRLGRVEEAAGEAQRLGPGELEGLLVSVTAALTRDPEDRLARSVVRRLPLLTHAEAALWLPATVPAPLRAPR